MAKFCTNCGATQDNSRRFCTECGAPLGGAAGGATQTRTAVGPPPRTPNVGPNAFGGDAPPPPGSKYEPISTGGFIGIMLLMCIPVVGLVLTIVWAISARKVNKRSLARAALILMAIMLVISLLIGMAIRALFNSAVEAIERETGVDFSEMSSGEGSAEGLGGLLGIIGGLTGDNSGVTNRDIEELEELEDLVDGLGGEGSGLDELIEGAQQANRDAEALNDGWPSTLRPYPGGEATAVASYRTEISGTTKEEMVGWINDLKGDGFQFQDFYEFGFSEEEMLDSMNAWWGYDGKTYLSTSYYDGVVTVDHTKELPDLESYFN